MNRSQAIALLPCFVSGDLPPEVVHDVEALVAGDPELGRLVDDLRTQQDRVVQALSAQTVPDALLGAFQGAALPELLPSAMPEPNRGGAGPFLITAAALAAAVLLAVVLATNLGPSDVTRVTVTSAIFTHQAALNHHLPSYSPQDAQKIATAFAEAGVPQSARMVPDLSHLGLDATAVFVIPGHPPGSAVAYRQGETDYLCQMWLGLQRPPRGTVQRQAEGIELSGYTDEGVAVVMWDDNGHLCMMSAAIPLEDLLDLVERRVLA